LQKSDADWNRALNNDILIFFETAIIRYPAVPIPSKKRVVKNINHKNFLKLFPSLSTVFCAKKCQSKDIFFEKMKIKRKERVIPKPPMCMKMNNSIFEIIHIFSMETVEMPVPVIVDIDKKIASISDNADP